MVYEERDCLQYFQIGHIPESDNWKADRLALVASAQEEETQPWEVVMRDACHKAEVLELSTSPPRWVGDIVRYLATRELPIIN